MEYKSNGFTLIEVLVTISIISILSGMFVLNFPSMDKNFKVEKEVREAVEKIKETREWSLSLKQPSSGSVVGYGINISDKDNGNTITIFLEDSKADDKKYNIGEEVEAINFNQVLIDSITQSAPAGKIRKADIFFQAPIPEVYINGGESNNEIIAVLKNKDGNEPKFELHINSAGLIYVKRI